MILARIRIKCRAIASYGLLGSLARMLHCVIGVGEKMVKQDIGIAKFIAPHSDTSTGFRSRGQKTDQEIETKT